MSWEFYRLCLNLDFAERITEEQYEKAVKEQNIGDCPKCGRKLTWGFGEKKSAEITRQ